MKKTIIAILIAILFQYCASPVDDKIIVLDLRQLEALDLSDKKNVETLWDVMHLTSSLQGIVNREQPLLYINYVVNERGINVDDYWWNKYRQEGEWLANKDTVAYNNNIVDVVKVFRNKIKGAVVYDSNIPSTSNIASSIAGIEDLIAVRYDNSENSIYSQLILNGPKLPVRCWLVNEDGTSVFTGKGEIYGTDIESTGSIKIDPYIWFFENYLFKEKCNTDFAAYYIDQYWRNDPTKVPKNHHQLTNHDFFISKKAFFFDLSPWGDEPATDDPTQKLGLDLETLKTFLQKAYEQNKGETFCHIGGFPSWAYKYTMHAGGKHDDVPTEWEFSEIISAYNAYKDADAIGLGAYANASFWQHFPLNETYPQRWITRDELKSKGFLNEDGTINFAGRQFIIFYVGDYDSSSWIAQTSSYIWDDPNRGSVPMMWSISPILAKRAPMAMHNFRLTASENDYFAAADNGAGYLLPGMLQAPRPISGLESGLNAWEKHCTEEYSKWGLTITGFIIDANGPALNKDGLDCYASFSPNGIVPQKTSLTALHKNMPIIRSDYDIVDNDPIKATDVIIERVSERPIPFHWFRAILKSPTWYKTINEELKKRETNIELIDAPSFFELYKIYLEQNPDAAAGKIEMN